MGTKHEWLYQKLEEENLLLFPGTVHEAIICVLNGRTNFWENFQRHSQKKKKIPQGFVDNAQEKFNVFSGTMYGIISKGVAGETPRTISGKISRGI